MWYKIRANLVSARAVAIEADSLEEAKRLVLEEGEGEWFDDEFEEIESYDYFVAETEEDANDGYWEMIDEED
jgi:hypothetical protein